MGLSSERYDVCYPTYGTENGAERTLYKAPNINITPYVKFAFLASFLYYYM